MTSRVDNAMMFISKGKSKMKVEKIKKISNQYSIIKQVYEDRILIRTNNIIYSQKYMSFMFLLTNNSCIWTRNVAEIYFGENQYDTFEGYLVEIKKADFERVKTYSDNFKNFNIAKQDEIANYAQLLKLAEQQEKENLVCKFC